MRCLRDVAPEPPASGDRGDMVSGVPKIGAPPWRGARAERDKLTGVVRHGHMSHEGGARAISCRPKLIERDDWIPPPGRRRRETAEHFFEDHKSEEGGARKVRLDARFAAVEIRRY